MSKQDFQQPLDPPRYRWLPHLIILMNLVAVAAGVFLLRSVEHRLVYSAGEELRKWRINWTVSCSNDTAMRT
jgi:hypothetical protein